jgi:3-dehydroquinate dehydratase-2
MQHGRVLVLNGPNLNLLGQREPDVYGKTTLAQIDASLIALGRELQIEVECLQSNHEGELVDAIQAAPERFDGIVINAGAYTHTSVALRDAFGGVGIPFVEVHISNVYAREEFRHHSLLSSLAVGVVVGFGPTSYVLGLRGIVDRLRSR